MPGMDADPEVSPRHDLGPTPNRIFLAHVLCAWVTVVQVRDLAFGLQTLLVQFTMTGDVMLQDVEDAVGQT